MWSDVDFSGVSKQMLQHNYIDLALEIRDAQPERDKHLIAEWCLDIFPLDDVYSLSYFKVRQHVRRLVVNTLDDFEKKESIK